MPSAAGDSWTYSIGNSTGITDTLILEITKQIPVKYADEKLKASTRTFYSKGSPRPNYEWLYWNDPKGLYILGGIVDSDTLLMKNIELRFPATVGESWSVPDVRFSSFDNRFYIRDTLTYSLVAKDEEFQTPAGNFKCYVYKYSQKPSEDVLEFEDFYNYYSPGIGLVAIIVKGQSDGRVIGKVLLLSYNIQ